MDRFLRQVPPAVQEYLRAFYNAVNTGREKEIQYHYERGWKDTSNRFYQSEPWPTLKEIEGIVPASRNFLVLYRLQYYRHMIMKIASDAVPASLGTYVEAWYAYKEFFDLAASPDSGLSLPPVWVYDIFYDFAYYHERFMRRRASGSASGASATVPAEDAGEDDTVTSTSSISGLLGGAANASTAAATVAAAAAATAASATRVSEEELALVWQLPDVMRYLHRMVEASGVRTRLVEGIPLLSSSFRDIAGYFSLVILCRTYTKLADYATAIQFAQELGVVATSTSAYADALFLRTPKCHASLVLYAGFALAMSRRVEDALRVMSRSLTFLHRSFKVLDDKEGGGGGAAGFLKNPVKKMLLLVAIGVAACPGVEIEDVVRRAVQGRHRDLVEALQSGALTGGEGSSMVLGGGLGTSDAAASTTAAATTTSTTTTAAGATSAAAANNNKTTVSADSLLDSAFTDAAPGFLTWSADVPAATPAVPAVILSPVAAALAADNKEKEAAALAASGVVPPPAPVVVGPLDAILATQRSLFHAEIAQRTSGVATLRSYLRLYTSIDVSKLATYAGMSQDDTRSALTSMKIKSASSSGRSAAAAAAAAAEGGVAGLDALHFFLVGDIVEVEEYRPPHNAAQWFVTNIDRLSKITRDLNRPQSSASSSSGATAGGSSGNEGGNEHRSNDRGGERGAGSGGDRRGGHQGGGHSSPRPGGGGGDRRY